MNQELKDKWVAALNSGEYKQTHESELKKEVSDGFEFCALGVLAEIMGVNEAGNPYQQMKDNAGLTDMQVKSVWHLNDVQELEFSQIADYINTSL